MTTWKKQLKYELEENGEDFDCIISSTLTEEQMNVEFDGGYGAVEGEPFTVWTNDYVYFPCSYDGSEWVGSASRNPNGKPTKHQGGLS